jgi:hypothetical protein
MGQDQATTVWARDFTFRYMSCQMPASHGRLHFAEGGHEARLPECLGLSLCAPGGWQVTIHRHKGGHGLGSGERTTALSFYRHYALLERVTGMTREPAPARVVPWRVVQCRAVHTQRASSYTMTNAQLGGIFGSHRERSRRDPEVDGDAPGVDEPAR